MVVEHPENARLSQICAGCGALWALGRDHSVWFRRGVSPIAFNNSLSNEEVTGVSWLKMFGNLAMIGIGPNNQVFGVTNDDHTIVIRTGITDTELSGKTWRSINLPVYPFDPDNPDGGSYDSDTSGSVGSAEKSSEAGSIISRC